MNLPGRRWERRRLAGEDAGAPRPGSWKGTPLADDRRGDTGAFAATLLNALRLKAADDLADACQGPMNCHKHSKSHAGQSMRIPAFNLIFLQPLPAANSIAQISSSVPSDTPLVVAK